MQVDTELRKPTRMSIEGLKSKPRFVWTELLFGSEPLRCQDDAELTKRNGHHRRDVDHAKNLYL